MRRAVANGVKKATCNKIVLQKNIHICMQPDIMSWICPANGKPLLREDARLRGHDLSFPSPRGSWWFGTDFEPKEV